MATTVLSVFGVACGATPPPVQVAAPTESADLRWEWETPHASRHLVPDGRGGHCGAWADEDRFVVGCREGGAVRWSLGIDLGARPDAYAVVDRGVLFIAVYNAASTGALVAAHDIEDGVLRWTRSLADLTWFHLGYSSRIQMRLRGPNVIVYRNETAGAAMHVVSRTGEMIELWFAASSGNDRFRQLPPDTEVVPP